MREPPRRRRLDDERGEGGLPLFPLVLVVILAGLLLGGVLAHFFGGSNRVPTPATRVAIAPATIQPTPPPSVASLATATPSPAPTPSATPTAKSTPPPRVTPAARVSPTARPTVRASVATATHAPATVSPAPRITPAPSRTTPTPAAAATPVAGDPAGVVRAYLGALARGDRQTAAGYLSTGAPTESFMTAGSRIAAIRSTAVGAQQYRVTADVQTSSGEYYVTFTLAPGPGGLQITDHYAIKPQ